MGKRGRSVYPLVLTAGQWPSPAANECPGFSFSNNTNSPIKVLHRQHFLRFEVDERLRPGSDLLLRRLTLGSLLGTFDLEVR